MKRVLLLMMIVALCAVENVRAIDLEARAGLGYFGYYGHWDMHLGALASFQMLDKFYLRPGIFLNLDSGSQDLFSLSNAKLGVTVPLYASYILPVTRVMNIRMNVGPFVGRSRLAFNVGTAVEAGLEYRKYYAGFFWFKDIAGNDYSRVNLSIGYKFSL